MAQICAAINRINAPGAREYVKHSVVECYAYGIPLCRVSKLLDGIPYCDLLFNSLGEKNTLTSFIITHLSTSPVLLWQLKSLLLLLLTEVLTVITVADNNYHCCLP